MQQYSCMDVDSLERNLAPWTTPRDEQTVDRYSVFARLIWQLADGTSSLSENETHTLCDIARVFARSALLTQQIASADSDPQLRSHNAAAAQICQLDATLRLARLVPAEHSMWRTLQWLQLEVADSTMVEQAFVLGYRRLRTLERATAIELAIGRNALARICPYVIGARDDRFDPAPFDQMIRHLSVALQALQDVRTWATDAVARRPSLVLAGLGRDFGVMASEEMAALRLEIIGGGHLRAALDLASEQLITARRVVDAAFGPRLQLMFDQLRANVEAVRKLLPGGASGSPTAEAHAASFASVRTRPTR